MKVIDVFSGKEAASGVILVSPSGRPWTLLSVEEHFLSSKVRVRYVDNGQDLTVSSCVRYTHPRYWLQKVAFVEPP